MSVHNCHAYNERCVYKDVDKSMRCALIYCQINLAIEVFSGIVNAIVHRKTHIVPHQFA